VILLVILGKLTHQKLVLIMQLIIQIQLLMKSIGILHPHPFQMSYHVTLNILFDLVATPSDLQAEAEAD
jgi:hypothetical protein